MKKQFLFAALAAGALLLGACNNEEAWESGTEEIASQESGQQLVLALEDGGMTAGTRAVTRGITTPGDPGAINATGRPFFSIMADQNIQNIMLYFVSQTDNKLVLAKKVTAAMWAQSTAYSNGREMTLSLKNGEKLDGNYTVYAVGYSATNDASTGYGFTPAATEVDKTDNGAAFTASDFSAVIQTVKDAEEIFAGSIEVTADEDADSMTPKDGSGHPQLVLYRQVAGITGYFTNLPAKVGETVPTHLRLVASNKSDKVFFGALGTNATDDTSITTNYVVNGAQSTSLAKDAQFWGSAANDGYILYEIDLSKWFPKGFANSDLDNDGYVGYKDVKKYLESNGGGTDYSGFWKNPNAGLNDRNQSLVRGSVWAGKFVIPFKLVTGKQTLQLQLICKDAKGTHIMKYWNINVDKANLSTGSNPGTDVSTGIVANNLYDESTSIYNIYRNHTYSIGAKKFNDAEETDPDNPDPNPTDPTDPTDPDPTDPDTDDQPSELDKGQDLIIRVNSNWEANHDMTLD